MSDELETAREVLKKAIDERLLACQADMQEVLDRYNCMLDAEMLLKNNQTPAVRVAIVPKPA